MANQCRILDDEQALDVLLADPELLAHEFEAIIAANYPASPDRPEPAPPPRWPGSAARRAPVPRPARPSRGSSVPSRVASARRRARARERGPPAAEHPTASTTNR